MPTIASLNKKVGGSNNSNKYDSPDLSLSPHLKDLIKTQSSLKKETAQKNSSIPHSPLGARDSRQSFHDNFKLNKDMD
jgi:hypothetical protein